MTKELIVKPADEVLAVGSQIDQIVKECMPLATQESQNFVQALTLANGIKALRQIFKTDPHIKETVEAMQNTNLGFMTDRTPQAIARAKADGKTLHPYTYEETSEVCIEAMLKGYRISGNEFNMLVNRFYPAKDGKFRKIVETEGITDFQFTTTSPMYEAPVNNIQYAKVQAFASWKKDGVLATLGSSTKTEDKLIFKIRVNRAMGEDAIVGKALSKLFSRVLMRITGKILPESTDVMEGDVVDAETTEAPEIKTAEPGTAEKLYGGKPKNDQEEVKSEAGEDEPEKKGDDSPYHSSDPVGGHAGANTPKTEKKGSAAPPEKDADEAFIAEFWGLRKGDGKTTGLKVYESNNRHRLVNASKVVQDKFDEKYLKIYEIPYSWDWAREQIEEQAWNGLYYGCPNMGGNPIPKKKCTAENCDQFEGCPAPYDPKHPEMNGREPGDKF